MKHENGSIKCVVWDLDDTLWDGTLLEGSSVELKKGTVEIIKLLDHRGILQSIASKNNHSDAMKKIGEFGIDDYFLYPQIHWGSKVQSIRDIARLINIGMDSIAFVDDNPAEIEEVTFSLPEIRCINADNVHQIKDMPCMIPRFTTADQRRRRKMYLSNINREVAAKEFVGPEEKFLATLDMNLSIFPAKDEDLQRAEELTVRTNQLNATGHTYSYDELNHFRRSLNHVLLMAKLTDRFGAYGHIGLALLECQPSEWVIKLLLMSCRVMSRGVGSVLLNYIINSARGSNMGLKAEFVPNDRNRMMLVTYRFAGFEEIENQDGLVIFEHPLDSCGVFPDYMKISIE